MTTAHTPAPRVVCVLEPEGAPLLVLLPDGPRLPDRLNVYARNDQHTTASRDYIRAACRDVSPTAPSVRALVREWCSLGPGKTDPDTVQFFTRGQSGLS